MLEDIQKKERKKDLEREDILQSLEEIKQCMESFDFAQATERLRDVMKCEMAQEYRQVLTQISRCVEEIDIQAMEEWMKKI